jgi:hypothetical protein
MADFRQNMGIYPVGIPGEYYIDIKDDRVGETITELVYKRTSYRSLASFSVKEPGVGVGHAWRVRVFRFRHTAKVKLSRKARTFGLILPEESHHAN